MKKSDNNMKECFLELAIVYIDYYTAHINHPDNTFDYSELEASLTAGSRLYDYIITHDIVRNSPELSSSKSIHCKLNILKDVIYHTRAKYVSSVKYVSPILTVKIKVPLVYVRSGPSRTHTMISKVCDGMICNIYDVNGDWLCISEELNQWINSRELKIVAQFYDIPRNTDNAIADMKLLGDIILSVVYLKDKILNRVYNTKHCILDELCNQCNYIIRRKYQRSIEQLILIGAINIDASNMLTLSGPAKTYCIFGE